MRTKKLPKRVAAIHLVESTEYPWGCPACRIAIRPPLQHIAHAEDHTWCAIYVCRQCRRKVWLWILPDLSGVHEVKQAQGEPLPLFEDPPEGQIPR